MSSTLETLQNVKKSFLNPALFLPNSISDIKDSLAEMFYSNDRGIYIFTGEDGSGKSRIVKDVVAEIKDDIFFLKKPPANEREFLEEIYMQLRNKKFSQNVKLDEVRIRVNDAFKKMSHTIIIDGIDIEQSSIIYELGDVVKELDGLKVIFVTSIEVANKLSAQRVEFFDSKSRLEIGGLTEDETEEFLELLLSESEPEQTALSREYQFVHEVTDGNISKVIKLVDKTFEILILAHQESLDKFKSMNDCIVIMSAIDCEFLDGQE